jgi:hypothetical protein
MPFSKKPFFFARCFCWAAALVAGSAFVMAAHAANPENFQVKTTTDLVALCSTDPSASDYPQTIAFCHGYAVGAFAYYSAAAAADPALRFICLPNPSPARSQAIVDFIGWTRTHPNEMAAPAIDSVFRYLGERYPCRK